MPVSATQAAIASSSIRPYMWITTGPRSMTLVLGEGIDAIIAPEYCRGLADERARGGSRAPAQAGNRARRARPRGADRRPFAAQAARLHPADSRPARALLSASARCAAARRCLAG